MTQDYFNKESARKPTDWVNQNKRRKKTPTEREQIELKEPNTE